LPGDELADDAQTDSRSSKVSGTKAADFPEPTGDCSYPPLTAEHESTSEVFGRHWISETAQTVRASSHLPTPLQELAVPKKVGDCSMSQEQEDSP
jgi:hypothetical protein